MKIRKVLSQALMGALFAGGSLAIFNSQASADTHVVTRQGETIDGNEGVIQMKIKSQHNAGFFNSLCYW